MDLYFSFAGRHYTKNKASYRSFAFSTFFLRGKIGRGKNKNKVKSGNVFF